MKCTRGVVLSIAVASNLAALPAGQAHAGPFTDWLFGRTYPVTAPAMATAGACPTLCPTVCASPCATAPSMVGAAMVQPTALQPHITGYTPSYQSTWNRVPVTYYRPVAPTAVVAGYAPTTLQPCNSYTYQVRRTPILDFLFPWRRTTPVVPVYPGSPTVAGYAPPGVGYGSPYVSGYSQPVGSYAPSLAGGCSTCPTMAAGMPQAIAPAYGATNAYGGANAYGAVNAYGAPAGAPIPAGAVGNGYSNGYSQGASNGYPYSGSPTSSGLPGGNITTQPADQQPTLNAAPNVGTVPSNGYPYPGTSPGNLMTVPADPSAQPSPNDVVPDSAYHRTPWNSGARSSRVTDTPATPRGSNTGNSVYQVKPIPDPELSRGNDHVPRGTAPPLLNTRERSASAAGSQAPVVTPAVWTTPVHKVTTERPIAREPKPAQKFWNDSGWSSAKH